MAIPVVLAETVAVTELYLLFTRNLSGRVKRINAVAGAVAGLYFFGVFIYLIFNAVIPLTVSGEWRGIADVVAVGFYLMGVVPLGGLFLLESGLVKRNASSDIKLAFHAKMVALFLIVAHVAMIFGMLNPTILGWSPDEPPSDNVEKMRME